MTGKLSWKLICLLSPSSPLVQSSPMSSPVPTSSPEWAPVSHSSHERDSVPKSSQEWALTPEAHEYMWPGSCCTPPALGPSSLLPGSSLLRHLPGLCPSSSSQRSILLLTLLLRSHPLWFYGVRTHLSGRGRYVRIMDLFCPRFCSVFPYLVMFLSSFSVIIS